MFLREDGVLFAGGNNDYGMLGTKTTSGKLPAPHSNKCYNISIYTNDNMGSRQHFRQNPR